MNTETVSLMAQIRDEEDGKRLTDMIAACRMAGIQIRARGLDSDRFMSVRCIDESKNAEFSNIVRMYNDGKLEDLK